MTSLSGPALHSGAPSTVRIARRPDDGLGLRFFFPGFDEPLDLNALGALRRSARRATVLEDGSGAIVRTPEHLLAAALFFAEESLDVACDADEPPGLDGSAKPWFDLLASLAPGRAAATRCREYDAGLTWSHAGREGSLHAAPAPRFSVTYTLERGSFRETFRLETAAAAPADILPARTFIFWKDWREASGPATGSAGAGTGGLLEGAGAESGLLLAESPEDFAAARAALPQSRGNAFPLIHPEALRMPAEAARHKILDLLGDLALNGPALPRLRLGITNGGHALNHLLLDALRTRASGRPDTPDEGTVP